MKQLDAMLTSTYNQMKEKTLKAITIKDAQDRRKLSEGRTNNMAFAFLKKLKADKYETVHAPSPCKDYLNDVVYAEHLNVSVQACGLSYSSHEIFDKKTSYMTIKMLPSNGGGGYYRTGATLESDTKLLEKNFKNIEKLLNWIEVRLDIPLTKITKANDDFYLVTFSYYWSSQTYLISLYSLLLRMAQFYDGTQEPNEYLNGYKDPLDISLWMNAKPKLMLLMGGYKTIQEFDPKTGGNIHNMGISTYNNFKL